MWSVPERLFPSLLRFSCWLPLVQAESRASSLSQLAHHVIVQHCQEAPVEQSPTRQVFRLNMKKGTIVECVQLVKCFYGVKYKEPGPPGGPERASWHLPPPPGNPQNLSIKLFLTVSLQGQGSGLTGPLMPSTLGCRSRGQIPMNLNFTTWPVNSVTSGF